MKRVEDFDPETGQHVVLATFELVGEQVVADYQDDHYREMLALNGIFTQDEVELRPADGRPFYDALDVAYRRSSCRRVVTA